MSQQALPSVDISTIQLKAHNKYKVFGANTKLRDHVNLLAVASKLGMLFVGNPFASELKVLILQDILYAKETSKPVHFRKVTLPSTPNIIACNADCTMLAISYTLQNCGVLDIYDVASFAAVDTKLLYSVRLANDNAFALQLLWNPVLRNIIGIVLNNGTFAVYTLKEGGAFEMCTLQNKEVKCGCWSPKGKQIVLGFPSGKLQQYKPDLTAVKNIICPADVHPGPFNTIAVHWLSTFQFIVCFLQQGEDSLMSLYIVNVPKGSNPMYINFNDICYSSSGPREHQIQFTHIPQWNLLLVSSANGVEVGVLGSKDITDQPTWVHYMLLDEARIELPLTETNDETYPIGLVINTSSIHQLTVGEKKLDTMPMIHVLSTHGDLLSFNFINLIPNSPNICSTPSSINFVLDKFTVLEEEEIIQENAHTSSSSIEKLEEKPTFATAVQSKIAQSYGLNIQMNNINFQSPTPFREQTALSNAVPKFVGELPSTVSLDTDLITKKNEINSTDATSSNPILKNGQQSAEMFKALYTVSPVFDLPTKSVASNSQTKKGNSIPLSPPTETTKSLNLNINETNDVVQQMINIQISAFDKEVQQLKNKLIIPICQNGNTMKSYTTRLINLQDVIDQAKDRDFVVDVQNLRHSLTESYEMLSECRTKLEVYKNPDIEEGGRRLTFFDCISQRQLKALRSYLAINNSIMQQLEEQIDLQWSYYQDLVRRSSKSQMRIPYLDGIYQQMTKLKHLLTQQQTKLDYIKAVLKQNNLSYKSQNIYKYRLREERVVAPGIIDSIADSILSLSLSHVTDVKSAKLSQDKMRIIRNFVQGKMIFIKPQRPYRKQLTSEIILESKILIKKKNNRSTEIISKSAGVKLSQEKSLPASNTSQPKITESITTKPLQNLVNVETPIVKSKENSLLMENKPFHCFNFGGGNAFTNITPKENSQQNLTLLENTSGNEKTLSNLHTHMKIQTSTHGLAGKNNFIPQSGEQEKCRGMPDNFSSLTKDISNVTNTISVSKASADNYNTFMLQQFGNTDLTKNVVQENISITNETNNQGAFGLPAISSISAPFNLSMTNSPTPEKRNEKKHTNIITGVENTYSGNNFKSASQIKPKAKISDLHTDLQPPRKNSVDGEDKFLKSINICKPAVKEIDAPKSSGDTGSSTLNSLPIKFNEGNNFHAVTTPNCSSQLDISSSESTIVVTPNDTSHMFTSPEKVISKTATTIAALTPLSTVATTQSITMGAAVTATVPDQKPLSFVGAAAFKLPIFSTASPIPTAASINSNPITTQTTSSATTFFPTMSTNSGANVFANEPKEPLQSSFADQNLKTDIVPSTVANSIFANVAVNSTSLSGNIFGNSSRFNSGSSNIFGGAVAGSNVTSTIFGNSATKSTENSANVFGTPTQTNTASGGSLFSQNTFGQSSITGFSPLEPTTAATSASTVSNFSFTGSLLSSNNTLGGSLFGGAPQVVTESTPFGAPTSPATTPFNAFTQAASVVNSGFSSPTQQANTFAKPMFGNTPAFGSPPVFGSQPSFGGAPTFGSPKGFGTFSASNTTPFGAATQKNNIFETLGSTDTGLSFGNLAQSTNTTQSTPKPIFGGSSFMNYRA